MSDGIIVHYLGFQANQLVREYSFQVRGAGLEREFTLNIANDAIGGVEPSSFFADEQPIPTLVLLTSKRRSHSG